MSKVDLGIISKLPKPDPEWSKTIKDIYKQLGKSLLASKILTPTNLPQFVSYCIEVGVYLESAGKYCSVEKRVDKITTPSGNRTIVSGHTYAANMALQNALKIGREFGFTPATVNRIGVRVKEDGDDFSKFLKS